MFKVRPIFLKSLFYTLLTLGGCWVVLIYGMPLMFVNPHSFEVMFMVRDLTNLMMLIFFIPVFCLSHQTSIQEERWKNKN